MGTIQHLLPSAAFACTLSAQTFVVDVANGPGTNFTSLPAAVAAVPSGSTLLVRPGSYFRLEIQGKGLTVLADAGATLSFGLSVANTAAGQPVVVAGLRIADGGIQLSSCLGSVTLREVEPTATATECAVRATSCSQLLFDRCRFRGSFAAAATLADCANAVMIDTSITIPTGDALRCSGGALDLVGCELRGGLGAAPLTGFGLHMTAGSSARLLGTTQVFAGTSFPATSGPQLAIGGAGTVRSAPSATIVGPVAPGVRAIATPECALGVTGGALGSTVTASLVGAPGAVAALLLGEIGAPVPVPAFSDPFWLRPGGVVTMAVGAPAGALTAGIGVPVDPQLVGWTLGWQGLTWRPADGFTASNPASFTVR